MLIYIVLIHKIMTGTRPDGATLVIYSLLSSLFMAALLLAWRETYVSVEYIVFYMFRSRTFTQSVLPLRNNI